MRLHYNPDCKHNNLPTTPLRLMYITQQFAAAQQEITRLEALPLEASLRLVVDVHKVVMKLAMDRTTYGKARLRLAQLAKKIQRLDDENYTAEFRSRRIRIAAEHNDYELAAKLTNHFFDDIPRTAITEAHWRLAQGLSAQRKQGPDKAIPFYVTIVRQLETANRPCLHEMAVRHLAFCLQALGDERGAVTALRQAGLPASINPAKDEIALADLLVVPLR